MYRFIANIHSLDLCFDVFMYASMSVCMKLLEYTSVQNVVVNREGETYCSPSLLSPCRWVAGRDVMVGSGLQPGRARAHAPACGYYYSTPTSQHAHIYIHMHTHHKQNLGGVIKRCMLFCYDWCRWIRCLYHCFLHQCYSRSVHRRDGWGSNQFWIFGHHTHLSSPSTWRRCSFTSVYCLIDVWDCVILFLFRFTLRAFVT